MSARPHVTCAAESGLAAVPQSTVHPTPQFMIRALTMDAWEVSSLGPSVPRPHSTAVPAVTSSATSHVAQLPGAPAHSTGLCRSSSQGLPVGPCRWLYLEPPDDHTLLPYDISRQQSGLRL